MLRRWEVGDGDDGIEVIGNESFIGYDEANREILEDCDLGNTT